MSGRYKIAWLCEALLVSRSGYYDWQQRRQQPGPRQRANLQLRQRIREEWASPDFTDSDSGEIQFSWDWAEPEISARSRRFRVFRVFRG